MRWGIRILWFVTLLKLENLFKPMNKKIYDILHVTYASIYALLLLIPLYLIFTPINFYIKNNLQEYIPDSIFSIETLLSLIAITLLIVSAIQNIKLKKREITPSRRGFLVLTAIAMIIAALPFGYSIIVQNPYAGLFIIYLGPIALIIWLITLIKGFSLLRK